MPKTALDPAIADIRRVRLHSPLGEPLGGGMDIHKPKPWHGLREFLKEYLITVVGEKTAFDIPDIQRVRFEATGSFGWRVFAAAP